MSIRHALFDADGVVQRTAGNGWSALVAARLGDRTDEFVSRLWELEEPALRGHGDFPEGVGEVLLDLGLDVDAEELYVGVWLAIETLPETLAQVRRLRADGLGVHLVTNQHTRRADHMKQLLGYDDVFDTCFYSCDLGVAKPDPAFFTLVCERLRAAPGELVFVDDSDANVDGARAAGLHAFLWHHHDGYEQLARLLARVGL